MSTRVLHVVASVGDAYGGVSSAIAALGAVEQRAGHDASLLSLHRPDEGAELLSTIRRWYDVELLRPSPISGRFHGGRRLTAVLGRLVPQHDMVVVHGVFDIPSILAARTAQRFGVPYLLWPHGSLDPYDLRKHGFAKRKLASVWRETLGGAAKLVCTTHREAARCMGFGSPTQRAVLPLPLMEDVPAVDRLAARERLGLPAQARVALFLGRIDAKKGLPLLLSSFMDVARPDDILVIAGSGDQVLTRQLRQQAAPLGRQVRFTGWVDRDRRNDLLAAADLFTLLSDNENFSVAAAEALQAGLATMVSDQVYLADELAPVGATAVCLRRRDLAGELLRQLLDDGPRRHRIGAAGREWATSSLTVRSVASHYHDMVEEVLHKCRTSAY